MKASHIRYWTCERKGKFSLAIANKMVKHVAQSEGIILKVYLCPYCNNWHLTKKL